MTEPVVITNRIPGSASSCLPCCPSWLQTLAQRICDLVTRLFQWLFPAQHNITPDLSRNSTPGGSGSVPGVGSPASVAVASTAASAAATPDTLMQYVSDEPSLHNSLENLRKSSTHTLDLNSFVNSLISQENYKKCNLLLYYLNKHEPNEDWKQLFIFIIKAITTITRSDSAASIKTDIIKNCLQHLNDDGFNRFLQYANAESYVFVVRAALVKNTTILPERRKTLLQAFVPDQHAQLLFDCPLTEEKVLLILQSIKPIFIFPALVKALQIRPDCLQMTKLVTREALSKLLSPLNSTVFGTLDTLPRKLANFLIETLPLSKLRPLLPPTNPQARADKNEATSSTYSNSLHKDSFTYLLMLLNAPEEFSIETSVQLKIALLAGTSREDLRFLRENCKNQFTQTFQFDSSSPEWRSKWENITTEWLDIPENQKWCYQEVSKLSEIAALLLIGLIDPTTQRVFQTQLLAKMTPEQRQAADHLISRS